MPRRLDLLAGLESWTGRQRPGAGRGWARIRRPGSPRKDRGPSSRRALLPAILLLALLGACGRGVEPVPPVPAAPPAPAWLEGMSEGPWNLLLLTLDTTRRDALGCYGQPLAATPVLDSLAQAGMRFDEAVTSAPTTAPAHTTILTGLDPHEHGVRYNGRYVADDSLVTLAELFRERGYETAAFVAAFPLDARFGLDQGFDLYDDTYAEQVVSRSEETSQRRADAVTGAVLAWARERRPRPFFLWVHYFDPHAPWDPPGEYAQRFREQPYLGEVAFMDSQIGRLLSGLERLEMLKSTFILVVGDHGESLGEHGEETHSFFIYDATQLVPCILVPPAGWSGPPVLARGTYGRQIRLRDLSPTLANLMGWDPEPWTSSGSVSLLPAFVANEDPPVPVAYLETLVPKLDYGWSDLRGVRTRDWKYIRAPRPELYRLAGDPDETVNVIEEHPGVADTLSAWLDWYLARETEAASQPAPVDRETLERLRSLGYLGGTGRTEGSGADPKDRIEAYHAVMAARSAAAEYKAQEAIRLLEPLVRREPENVELVRILAAVYALDGQLARAGELYDRVLERRPGDREALKETARLAAVQGDSARARRVMDLWGRVAPEDPEIACVAGEILERRGREGEAYELYRRELERHPDNCEVRSRLARIQRVRGESEAARAVLAPALELCPLHAAAVAELAELEYEEGRMGRVDSLVERALELDPFDPQANFRRGFIAREKGDLLTARTCYERAVLVTPEFAEARYNLGNVYLNLRQLERALAEYEAAMALGYESALLRTNQGVALAQMGRWEEARRAWERALQLAPDEELEAGIRSNLEMVRTRLGGAGG